MSRPPVRVRALSIHARYRCGNSGVCCSSGWPIPVEREVEQALRRALADRRLVPPPLPAGVRAARDCLVPHPALPHGAQSVLPMDAGGRCAFLEPGTRCAVHRQLGEAALPSACRQFPRVVTLTPLGVSVTLSHHCPTAAALVFEPQVIPLRIVEQPRAFPVAWPYEGLDAREGWPPLLRPGVLMTWPALERWEEHAVSVLGDERFEPEQALERLAAAAEAARAWTPGQGDFELHLARCLERGSAAGGPRPAVGASVVSDAIEGWRAVAAAVPAGSPRPAPPSVDAAAGALVDAGWPAQQGPLRRWLAAKAFASWLALQGEGLRTTVLGLRLALEVARVEALRGCSRAARALDAEIMQGAFSRADLLLMQLADPVALARRLSRVEGARTP